MVSTLAVIFDFLTCILLLAEAEIVLRTRVVSTIFVRKGMSAHVRT
jgi:hypothetical protein